MSESQDFMSPKAIYQVAPSKATLFDVCRSKSLPTKTPPADLPSGPLTETSWIGSESSDTDSNCGDLSHLGTTCNSIENHLAFPRLNSDEYAHRANHLVSTEDSSILMQRNPRRILQMAQFDADQANKNHTYLASTSLQPNSYCCQLSHRLRKPLATSHYFREKKLEFFPELDPSLRAGDIMVPCNCLTESQKRESGVHVSSKRDRWIAFKKAGLNLVCDARDWVKPYLYWKIIKAKKEKRPVPPSK